MWRERAVALVRPMLCRAHVTRRGVDGARAARGTPMAACDRPDQFGVMIG
jgi:hypothetical protein